MVLIKFEKNTITSAELREILALVENQETSDKHTNTTLDIDGNYAHITANIDDDGDITII